MKTKKRINRLLVLGLVTLGLFASCDKKNDNNGTLTSFTAGIEQNAPSTRTYLSNWDIFWSDGDQILVTNSTGQQANFTLADGGEGTQTSEFNTSDEFDNAPAFVAAYPSTSANINNGVVTFNLLQTQTITEAGTFANGAMPMVAHADNTTLMFKNVLGGICFPLKGSFQVSKIELTAKDSEDMLWGQLTTGWNTSEDAPTMTEITGGSNSIELVCNPAVQLNTTTAEEFYIMVPPTMLEKGFTIKVYDETNAMKYEQTVDWTSTPQANFIPRNFVRVANELNIDMFNIYAMCSPEVAGTVDGAGAYRSGSTCTLSVTPATGYTFLGWKKDGAADYYSTETSISFSVTENASFVAYFESPVTVTVIADAAEGGTVSGGGTYGLGDECTITATPNSGWRFVGWKVTGEDAIFTTEPSYTFTVNADASFTALFTKVTVTTTSPFHIEVTTATSGGTVTNVGATIAERGVCYATNDTPTIDGNYVVGTTDDNFTAELTGLTKDVVYWVRAYVKEANGAVTYGNAIPFATRKDYAQDCQGRLPYNFSVSDSKRVKFSVGNLYYMGADGGYWKFADHQFDYLNNDQTSENPNINRDKFSFATSNQAHGGDFYQPWKNGYVQAGAGPRDRYYMNRFYAYHNAASGDWNHSLREDDHKADWGYNAIQNGGGTVDTWQTLGGPTTFGQTGGEWHYLLNQRTQTQYRYAFSRINAYIERDSQIEWVNGVMIFPDAFSWPNQYYPSYTNTQCNAIRDYSINSLTEAQWSILEKYGVAFLPAAGNRNNNGTLAFRFYGDNENDPVPEGEYGGTPRPSKAYLYNGYVFMENVGSGWYYWTSNVVNYGEGTYYPNSGDGVYKDEYRWIHSWGVAWEPGLTSLTHQMVLRNLGLSVRLVCPAE